MKTNKNKQNSRGGLLVRRHEDGIGQILQSCYFEMTRHRVRIGIEEDRFVDMCRAIIAYRMNSDRYGSGLREDAAMVVYKKLLGAVCKMEQGGGDTPVSIGWALIRRIVSLGVLDYLRSEGFVPYSTGWSLNPKRLRANALVPIVEPDGDSEPCGIRMDAASMLSYGHSGGVWMGLPEADQVDKERRSRLEVLLKAAASQLCGSLQEEFLRIIHTEDAVADADTQQRFRTMLPWLKTALENMRNE